MTDDIVKRLRIQAGVMEMGEQIAWGSDTALMREAAHVIEAMRKSQTAPEGWKLVPAEPTKKMIDAGRDMNGTTRRWLGGSGKRNCPVILVYYAMIDAAPQPEETTNE